MAIFWEDVRKQLFTPEQMEVNDNYGNLITEIRKARILQEKKQQELATAAKMTQAQISKILTFDRIPSLETFLKLSHALGYNVILEKKEQP